MAESTASSIGMPGMFGLSLGLQGLGSLVSAATAMDSADFDMKIAELNAQAAKLAGDEAARDLFAEGSDLLSTQRAIASASGGDSSRGSAQDVMLDTLSQIEKGALNIRLESLMSSLGFEAAGVEAELAGAQAVSSEMSSFGGSLLTGGLALAGYDTGLITEKEMFGTFL